MSAEFVSLQFKALWCPPPTTSHITLWCSRPEPAPVLPSPPGAPVAASVRRHVAAGQAERCDELWEAPGVCVHGDRGGPWTDQPQTESPAHSGSKSEGERKSCMVSYSWMSALKLFRSDNLLIFQLILELCKGSARGSVDTQAIQSYLDALPITSANTDVSTVKENLFNTK